MCGIRGLLSINLNNTSEARKISIASNALRKPTCTVDTLRKTIFAINMTADGCFGHEDGIADEELHRYFTELLRNVGVILFGRKTYELMVPYWPDVAKHQTEDEATNEFARIFDALERIVFSTSLKSIDDGHTKLMRGNLAEEVIKLKQQPGKDIAVGSLSLAAQLAQRDLIDEYHFLVHPVLAGKGPRLFEVDGLKERLCLELVGSKQLRSGVAALHYRRR